MIPISIIDNSFDINVTTSYFLSIQLALDGFSFCVLDPVSNEYIHFRRRPFESKLSPLEILKEELDSDQILLYPYQKVFFSYNSSKYTLVPDGLFNKESAASYMDFSFADNQKEDAGTYYNKIKMADSWCIFNIPNDITTLLEKYYSDIRYFCEAIPFIESALLDTSIDAKRNHVHLNINTGYFDIAVTSGNNLLLHNTFNFTNDKDFLYFTLFVFEQLELNASKTKVYLSGNITKNDAIYTILKKYIKRVEISETTKHFKFAAAFKNIALQSHLNLFNIPICV